MPLKYPFSAVVGCEYDPTTTSGLDDMGLALVLTSISPEIGGVLVRGDKGTAKSTTVRGLTEVLPWIDVRDGDRVSADPHDPAATSPDLLASSGAVVGRPVRLVELPVGATEDRVLGSLNLEKALTAGAVEFEPGLLARAHRGVLYVDDGQVLTSAGLSAGIDLCLHLVRADPSQSTQLARDIEGALAKFIQQPVVTVIVTNFIGNFTDQIRVIGQAARPQALPYRREMSVMDVVIAVGGVTEFASGNKASIIRTVDGKQEKVPVRLDDLIKDGDISANVMMRPGDILVIPESFF